MSYFCHHESGGSVVGVYKTSLTASRSFLKGSDCKLGSVLSFLLILNKKYRFLPPFLFQIPSGFSYFMLSTCPQSSLSFAQWLGCFTSDMEVLNL